MNEYVLVEFVAGQPFESQTLKEKLLALGTDFVLLKEQEETEIDEDGNYVVDWMRIQGKIKSEYASLIKLQDPFLAERMRISYIPAELKEKYRR